MTKVSPTQKLVLLCLADCHNGDSGRCDPTQAFMMEFTGLSNRSVSTAVMELERLGIIRRHTQTGSRSSYSFPERSEESSLPPVAEPVKEVHQPVNLPHPRSTFTSEPPAESCESPAGEPVNLLPKAVKEVHNNREEQGIEPEGTWKLAGEPPKLKVKPKAKTSNPDWREWNQRKADAANIVQLPLLAPPDFGAAWQRWCDYRTARATTDCRVASDALDWTEAAAKSTLIAAEKAADWHGWPAVIARMDEAIGGNWQGPNFDKIQPKIKALSSTPFQRPQSSSCL